MRKAIVVLVLLALAPAAWAQDAVNEERAKQKLGRFLTGGGHAPFGGETQGIALRGVERDRNLEAALGRGIALGRKGEFVAAVESGGHVFYFSRFAPLPWITLRNEDGSERAAGDRAKEIEKRIRFGLEDSVQRAKEFLADRYPDWGTRRFEVERKERVDRDALILDQVDFVERPRQGLAACWPNRVHVAVDPERGAIATYVGPSERIESAVAPRLSEKEARAQVVVALAKGFKRELDLEMKTFFEKECDVELVAVKGKDGKPRTAWQFARRIPIDAVTGELLVEVK